MGYRYNDKPPKPEDHLHKLAVRNGATLRAAFGCYYLKGHNPSYHDHIGWPNPTVVDDICQIQSNFRLFPFKEKTIMFDPIHLTEEGYNTASIVFENSDSDEYLSASAWIDEDDDNIVRIRVNTSFPTFEDKPIDIRYTLFVGKEEDSTIDAVSHGVISVLPGPRPLGGDYV